MIPIAKLSLPMNTFKLLTWSKHKIPTNIKNNPLPTYDLSKENKFIINLTPNSDRTIINENILFLIINIFLHHVKWKKSLRKIKF